MRALVTGGAGFIGSALVDRLLAEGHEVDVVDDLSTGSLSNLAEARKAGGKALRIHQLDIRVPELVELVALRRPEVVFHLAAQASVPASVARPIFDAEVNVLGTLNVLEGARSAGSDRVVFAASGGTLYGDPDVSKQPIPETMAHRPLSPYGVSKKSAIDYLVAYRELHAVEFTALALANVYGPRQDPHGESGVVAIFARRLVAAQPITIFGDGEQTRDFVYVDDVVDAFAAGAWSATSAPGGARRSTTSIACWRRRPRSIRRPSTVHPGPATCATAASTSGGPRCSSVGRRGPRSRPGSRRRSATSPNGLARGCAARRAHAGDRSV